MSLDPAGDAPRHNPHVIGNGSTSKMLQSLEEVLVCREAQSIWARLPTGVCVSVVESAAFILFLLRKHFITEKI